MAEEGEGKYGYTQKKTPNTAATKHFIIQLMHNI